MAAEIWTINLQLEDANHGERIVKSSMDRDFISFSDLVGLIEKFGYSAIDFLYYKKKDPLGRPFLVEIGNDSDVMKMIAEHEIEKSVHLCVMRRRANNEPIVVEGIDPEFVQEDILVEDDEIDEEPYEEEKDGDTEGGSESDFIDEDVIEAERIALREELAARKRRRADPMEHCGGDIDVEDLFVVDVTAGNQDVAQDYECPLLVQIVQEEARHEGDNEAIVKEVHAAKKAKEKRKREDPICAVPRMSNGSRSRNLLFGDGKLATEPTSGSS